ncbi:MAG: PLP-dependent aminotransferase family protein [Gulosibacter sp.]|uniref:aminotransferase-like domain-containing protein n=1 Tax=Gulosibacter sp. TaxID=2817531 RepID=UPI003F8EEFB3
MTTNTPNGTSELLASIPDHEGFGDASLIRQGAGVINLGGGNPDVDLLPTHLFKRAAAELFEDPANTATALKYSNAAGLDSLREAIGAREGIDPERVLVTTGGANGTALTALALFNDGDTVAVDAPVYPLFLRNLDLVRVKIVSVPVDAAGLDTDALEAQLRSGLRPKAVFTVPTFHNPTGATLSPERERKLVELAEHYGFTVIADDPYRELSFSGERPRPRPALIDTDRTVLINSFSKTLGPGTRLGWLGLPEGHTASYARLRNRLDGHSSGLVQELVRRIITDPGYTESNIAAGARYQQKAQTLQDALREQFGERIQWVEPHGGFFLWAWLEDDLDFEALFQAAQRADLSYQRGDWFAASPDQVPRLANTFRLSFCELDEAALREGAARLGAAWREVR